MLSALLSTQDLSSLMTFTEAALALVTQLLSGKSAGPLVATASCDPKAAL